MRNTITIALAGLIACLTLNVLGADEAKKSGDKALAPIAETKLGLAHGTVFETLTPDPVVPESSDPGAKPVIPRWNDVAPPMIPHGVADFLPITRDANACVDCHMVDTKAKGEPTPIPASHRTAAKPGEASAVAGARWICNSCHVQQTAARPLPASTRKAGSGKR